MEERIMLFTDGSVNTKTNIGYGAYVVVDTQASTTESSHHLVKVKHFENTSSTKLELETLLWALEEIQSLKGHIVIHTDSQNIIGLPRRRAGFEANHFLTKKKTLIGNHDLYKAFYTMIDQLDCSFVQVKGHKLGCDKDAIDHLFTLVDRASRNALRQSGQ